MTLFKIEWEWYEDYYHHVFSHDSKTHSDWIRDCNIACQQATRQLLRGKYRYCNYIGASEIIARSVTFLKKMGYTTPKIVKFSVFGNCIPEKSREDKEESQDFIKVIGQELYDKICEHNEKINKRR